MTRLREDYCLGCGARVYRTHTCRPVRPPTAEEVAALAAQARDAIDEGRARRHAAAQLDLFEEGA